MKKVPAAKTTRPAGGDARKPNSGRRNNFVSLCPWDWHARHVRWLTGDSMLCWPFAAKCAQVDVERLLGLLHSGLSQPGNEVRAQVDGLLGDLAMYAAGAHADADFHVGDDGTITVYTNLDATQLAINEIDATKMKAGRRCSGTPRVVMIDRISGKGHEVDGLQAVFHKIANVRAEVYRATDEAAYLARQARLGAEEVF